MGIKNRENSIVLNKAFQFAVKIVKLCRGLKESKEYDMSRQLLRSGTSIGANINEALAGSSSKDFQHKMTLALIEAQETEYWIKLLKLQKYLKVTCQNSRRKFQRFSEFCLPLLRHQKRSISNNLNKTSVI